MANTQTFTGDGTTTSFYFTFSFFGVNDIKVSVDGVAQTSDDIAIYPTTTPGDAPDVPYTGGRIDFATAPASGAVIKAWRNIEITRHIDYQPTSEPKSHQLNQDLNQCIEILKEQSGKISVLDGLDMDVIAGAATTITSHVANTSNPHSVTIAQIGALSDSTKYGASLVVSMDSSTYVVTAQLKDQDGNALGSAQTIDLPLESVVVSGSYDSANKKVVLTLKSGSTVEFSVADLISGLQTTIDSNNKLSADLVTDSTTTNKFVTASDITNWNGKANSADLATVATTGTLASLNDTTISTPSDGQVLMYDDGAWKNTTSTASVAWGGVTGTLSDQTDLKNALDAKQGTLTAGSNITITSGTISATDTTYSAMTGADGTNAGTSGLVPAPAATDNTKFLRGDGTWATAGGGSSLPSQTGNSGKFLTTDGTDASWATVSVPTVNDSTITITQGGVTKGTFTTNQASASTIALDAGGGSSDVMQSIDATKVGTLTITDSGDVSGWDSAGNNYLQYPGTLDMSGATSLEMVFAYTVSAIPFVLLKNVAATTGLLLYGMRNVAGVNRARFQLWPGGTLQSMDSTTALSLDTKYYLKITWDGTTYTMYLSTDGVTYNQENTLAVSDPIPVTPYVFGQGTVGTATLHLADCYIKKNGIMIWSGMDSVGLHQRVAKGHELIASQEPASGNGYYWYRKYADGWVEQGGIKTSVSGSQIITFPVAMSDTNYTIIKTLMTSESGGTVVYNQLGFFNKSTTTAQTQSGGFDFSWEVRGIAA